MLSAHTTPLPDDGAIGIAVNGVPFMTHGGELAHIFDECLGHVDANHNYHFHGPPTCLLQHLGGVGNSSWWFDGGWPNKSRPSPIVGWALDGFPIYGPYDEHGDLMRGHKQDVTLDPCNGKKLADGSYAYFTSPGEPYTVACFRGVPGKAIGKTSFMNIAFKGLTQRQIRCPPKGLQSKYYPVKGTSSQVSTPPLRVPECPLCEPVFFLFPVCPAPDFMLNYPRAVGILHALMSLVILVWFARHLKQARQEANAEKANDVATSGASIGMERQATPASAGSG